ncbi:MAG: tRNA (adenosine(37)-N6)-threonylcarbamoyltransferase complex dimerization subunit type 1 TsaB [Treponema sp.]|nr:tRNA (adenosine(37)-N6)-threonylcarbamoyltransferase complex dimerization subunit type 1 TsaB [Treponema sp.]
MKALAVDTSVTRITIAAKNDDHFASLTLDIGMKQSEKLLPSIDYVLSQVNLEAKDLEYTVCTIGPGSFTGLRLGLSALKALTLSSNAPVYGVSTLDLYANPYKFPGTKVLSVIDAKKEKFYASCVCNSSGQTVELIPENDWNLNELADAIKNITKDSKEILVCGPDAELFIERAKDLCPDTDFITTVNTPVCAENLFTIAEDMMDKKIPALADYDGPVYLRASEAEENLNK